MRDVAATCLNCGAALTGPYCAQCGQRHRDAADRTVKSLASEAFALLTSFDNRWWRTFVLLLAQPGQLTANHIAGRRAGQLGPVTLFLLTSVLLYVAIPLQADFHHAAGIDPSVSLRAASPSLPDWISARIAALGTTPAAFAEDFARRAPELKKALLILLAPFLALPLALLFWRRDRLLADHVVFAFHLTSALLLFIGAFSLVFEPMLYGSLRESAPWLVVLTALGGVAFVYAHVVIALRRVYHLRPRSALGAALALFAITIACLALFARGRNLFMIWWLTRT